jgi:hypothetical protein
MMTGTELEIIPPLHAEIAGSTAERRPDVYTDATTDLDLLAVWLKAHADGSHHTGLAHTVAYLGVKGDDVSAMSRKFEI